LEQVKANINAINKIDELIKNLTLEIASGEKKVF
jgi:hypothetical protein